MKADLYGAISVEMILMIQWHCIVSHFFVILSYTYL